MKTCTVEMTVTLEKLVGTEEPKLKKKNVEQGKIHLYNYHLIKL